MNGQMRIVIFGLAATSSWGNGHATTYRGLMRGLAARGHDVLFFERDQPWYAQNRDLPALPYGRVHIYSSLPVLKRRFEREIRDADLVIVGSYVSAGTQICQWVCDTARGIAAFYDIDTPVTLAGLERGGLDYISPAQIPKFDLYLSFTGGPLLRRIEQRYGARAARPLYCSVDPTIHRPERRPIRWDLGYMGTYSQDRQPMLQELMLEPARRWGAARMIVAGAQYPHGLRWPSNVKRVTNIPPCNHRKFYCSQRFTLNLTGGETRRAGYSPSVRLFEAAACGTAILSDEWPGIEAFFRPGAEILITHSAGDTLRHLRELPDSERVAIGQRARLRILHQHTCSHRAAELEEYVAEAQRRKARPHARAGAAPGIARAQQAGG